jgi:uncharacterized protein (DUF2141 family)
MKLKYLIYLLTAVGGFALTTMETGCANIIPPTGGPRDSLPPVLLNATPADSTLKFAGKKIVLNFNEFVQIDNVQQNLLVSPVPLVNPTVESKLKTITITIRDTLKPNTTYALDFGNSIKDVNEGNIYKNFTYLFTTGTKLDSLQLAGKVIIAETGKADSTLIVMLYKNHDDSAIIKERPRYMARVDSSGNFHFRNLEPGTFSVYAVKDEGARRYQSAKSLFAFFDTAVSSESQKKDIMLYAFTAKDTATKPISAIVESAAKKGKEVPRFFKIQNNLSNNELDLLSNLEISSPERLYHYDSTKILFSKDSLPVKGYSITRDTSGKNITLKYAWTENTNYTVIIDTTFATDSAGRRIFKNDTLTFQTKKESEYGLVRLRFIHLDLSRNPVLQFTQSQEVKYSYVFKNNEFYTKLFNPGEYELRIVFDDNKNGVWDTGNFFGKHVQPEKVLLISRKINVKANWDNEVDIQL